MRPFARIAPIALLALAAGAARAAAPATVASPGLYDLVSERVAAAYDSARGGFVDKKGVPSESAVELALRRANERSRHDWRRRALATIQWTQGLVDSAGGGYHHSAESADRTSATFDKRTDSNARRLENLLLAWEITGDAAYRREAARIADFMVRVPFDPRGGFSEGQFGHGELVPEINGIAAHAWLEWAAVTRDPHRRAEALATLDRMWTERWVESHGFLRADPAKAPEPRLVDQVEMGRAYVLGASICGRARDRERAVAIGKLVLERFPDKDDQGGFRAWTVRKKNGTISGGKPEAAGNARASRFLCELSALTGDDRYRLAAGHAWMRFARENEKPSLGAADWALAVRAAVDADLTGAPEWAESKSSAPAQPRSIRIKRRR
jgi:uncharacterized protein YyaL (SSP411 family)